MTTTNLDSIIALFQRRHLISTQQTLDKNTGNIYVGFHTINVVDIVFVWIYRVFKHSSMVYELSQRRKAIGIWKKSEPEFLFMVFTNVFLLLFISRYRRSLANYCDIKMSPFGVKLPNVFTRVFCLTYTTKIYLIKVS